jgi:D-alanyl-D-alanine carboxypeptidase
VIVCLALTGGQTDALAKAKKKQAAGNPKYASIVVDTETGVILSQRYADRAVHPASLTKIMTLLMAFEALDAKQITLRDRIPVSARAAGMPPSKLGVAAGSTIRVEDAIYALVTKSANDVASAMAEYLGGTESRFAQLMTERARDIGMKHTVFRNASGLPNDQQITTARDMATLSRYVVVRYPHYYRYFGTKQFTYRGKTHGNHNRLLYSYPGMDGFKTGYVNASGFNLVASAKRNGKRLIGVVFGGQTSKTRNDHMVKILDEGFNKIKRMKNTQVAGVAQTPLQKQAQAEAELKAAQTAVNAPIPPRRPDNNPADPQALAGRAANLAPAQIHSRFGENQTSYASLSALNPNEAATTQTADDRIRDVKQTVAQGYMEELSGQGDYDTAAAKRLETGLLAVAVHKGQYQPRPEPVSAVQNTLRDAGHAMIARMAKPEDTAPTAPTGGTWQKVYAGEGWGIQIGAYNTKVATDEALRAAIKKLPADMAQTAKPVSVPLRTSGGIMFRARLSGLTNSQAVKACGYFSDCLTIAPENQ